MPPTPLGPGHLADLEAEPPVHLRELVVYGAVVAAEAARGAVAVAPLGEDEAVAVNAGNAHQLSRDARARVQTARREERGAPALGRCLLGADDQEASD